MNFKLSFYDNNLESPCSQTSSKEQKLRFYTNIVPPLIDFTCRILNYPSQAIKVQRRAPNDSALLPSLIIEFYCTSQEFGAARPFMDFIPALILWLYYSGSCFCISQKYFSKTHISTSKPIYTNALTGV